jgi:sporulation protein YlmC with PRC-barrel domain
MIRATELAGRAVIDIDAAERLGTIEKLILDPEGRRVAGFIVSRGSGFPGSKEQSIVPAAAVRAIGPDAVTVHQTAVVGSDISRLDSLPRGSDLVGRKVVSEDGRLLGKVNDVLIDRESGRILGYLLSDHTPSKKLEQMLGADRKKRRELPYLPADANLRAGRDLIVASEDAVSYDWSEEDAAKADESTPPVSRWADPLETSDRSNTGTPSSGPMIDDVHPQAQSQEDVDGRPTTPHLR